MFKGGGKEFLKELGQVLSKEPKNASTENGLASTNPNVQKREMGGRRCRVVFSYAPQHDDELPLCVGQTITILQEVEEGWWKGVLDGQVGMFPSNFVEDIAEGDVTPKSAESNLENVNNQLNINGDQKEIKPKPIQGMGYGVKLTDLKKEVNNKKESEIPASNGSAKILGSSGSSAFQPVHKSKDIPKENGQVKELRELPHRLPPALEPKADKITTKTDKTRINAADKERISSLEKDRITITIGDEKSKVEQGSKKDFHSTAINDVAPQLPPPQLPPKPVRELARVMFPYAAEHEDELELKEGDIIAVLCKELEDKGWWRGELNGHVGVFPDNFVELLSVEETAKPPRPEKTAAVLAKKGSPSSSADSTPTGTLSKTDKEPPPPLPEKKVQPPPPPEKKPGITPSSVDAHDGCISSKEQNETTMNKIIKPKLSLQGQSLSLDLEGERLTHVTQDRPKGPPRRRPPSGLFKENMKNQISADSDTLLPTPEDDLEDDTTSQPNGQASSVELRRSPSVPSLAQPSTKPPTPFSPTSLKPNVEIRSRSETTNNVPWIQELKLNQRKKISGVFNAEDAMTTSGPVVSPKPVTVPQKSEDKSTKAIKPMSDSADSKVKSVEPRIPSPDYESIITPSLPITPKTKPLPRTPSSVASNVEKRKSVNGTESLAAPSVVDVKKPNTTPDAKRSSAAADAKKTVVTSDTKKPILPDSKKLVTISDAKKAAAASEVKENKSMSVPQNDLKNDGSQLEEKVNAIYKELLPKIKVLEDRLEENRKHQSHCIQMLMTELDEERKKRACMEVEIERLKKLVHPYAQV